MDPTEFQPVALPFGGETFYIAPDLDLVLEIEDELGSLPALFLRFRSNEWKASEAITLIQMMLAHAGKTIDWKDLGRALLAEGMIHYRQPVLDLLSLPVTGRKLIAA